MVKRAIHTTPSVLARVKVSSIDLVTQCITQCDTLISHTLDIANKEQHVEASKSAATRIPITQMGHARDAPKQTGHA